MKKGAESTKLNAFLVGFSSHNFLEEEILNVMKF